MGVRSISYAEADKAYEQWGCNCGPAAVAAIMGMSLEEVRPLMGDFERKKYTNPTLMWETLNRIGRPWRKAGIVWPAFGLARIQWHGPWMNPGVPMAARYRATHWVASFIHPERGHGIFDVNATKNGTGWIKLQDWEDFMVHEIMHHVPRSDGEWSITHGVEVET